MKKQLCVFLSVLLLLLTLSVPIFVHAGDLPAIPFPTQPTAPQESSTVEEVSTDYEVPIIIEPTTASLYLNKTSLTMHYKDAVQLKANASVTWSSSDESVVTVSGDGTVTAVGIGRASVKAVASDGRAKACTVRVRYSFIQWCIMILLLGWLWNY